IGTNPSLFSQDVTEAAAGNTLNTDGATATRTSSANSDELSIDLNWASGLFGLDSSGSTVAVTCRVRIEYSPMGTGVWTGVGGSTPGFTVSTPAATPSGDSIYVLNGERKAIRVGVRWKVANGQYDVRVTRVSTSWGTSDPTTRVGDLTWSIIRSIRYTTVSTTGTKKLAMRIKATDQLSGNISQFNCIISQPIPVWHPDTGVWVTEFSNNPAFVFRWLLRDCPANPRRIDESRIDDEVLIAWAAECDLKEYCYSNTLDQGTTLYALLKDVAAAGRASFNIRNGKYGVVRDELQAIPMQVFTPRNSSNFGGNRAFPDAVHALRVQFINEEAGFQQDERIVYDDGYGDMAFNLVPNGNFSSGNINGWVSDPVWLGGNGYNGGGGGIQIDPSGSAVSPTFNVVPGRTYRLSFTGFQATPGTQNVFHRILYGSTSHPNILQSVSGYVGNVDFMSGGNLVPPPILTYTNDWLCPAGVFYASLAMYELGTAIEIYTHVTASDLEASLATKFEQMQIAGCTNANAAWRLGRYHLAVSRLRPNTYFWNADIENLVCSRGDLVLFANDVIGVGMAQGRITRTIELDPSNPVSLISGIVLDEPVTGLNDGTTYAVRIRRQDGQIALTWVTLPVYGEPTTLINLTTQLADINPGDLVLFGEATKDSIPLVITKIEPGADFSAKITAVDAAYAVLNADAGTPPPWTSQITGQPWLDAPNPPDLLIIDSNQTLALSNDAGNTSAVMNVTVVGPWSGIAARPITQTGV
ncbi:MAG TPA: hypothetical protein VK638_10740, partial [Edaphobacter sp.]|nr:hypothetical protein [Edaphobacter sp.]